MRKKTKGKTQWKNKFFSMAQFGLLIPLTWAIASESLLPIVLFLAFGIFGILGEVVFDEWWVSFYEKPLYLYRQQKFDYGFSSKLNFIPYGLGGLLFLLVIYLFSWVFPEYHINLAGLNNAQFYYVFAIYFLAGIALQFMIRAALQFFHPRSYKFKTPNFLNYLLFFLPFLMGLLATAYVFNGGFLLLALVFGLLASLVEYLYGKFLQFSFKKKFWDYIPWSFDHGHFSPLNLLAFSFMGFYFWGIYAVCKMFLGYV